MEAMMGRLLSWIEYRAWMERIAVTVCSWCDCSLLATVDNDDPAGPVLNPTRWPRDLAAHDGD